MALLNVAELPPQRADEAYGLVRLGSNLSERDWRACVEASREAPHGVLCVSAVSGVLMGVAAYAVAADDKPGKLLKVRLFLAFDLGGNGTTGKALRDGLDSLAERLGCRAVLFAEESRGLLGRALV